MFLQLHLVLPGQILVLLLELGEQQLFLELLLLLQGQKLPLQLPLPRRSIQPCCTALPARLCRPLRPYRDPRGLLWGGGTSLML